MGPMRILFITSFIVGLLSGGLYLAKNPTSQMVIPFGEKQTINIEQQRIGFLPYWLLSYAQDSYQGSLTNLSYFSLTLDEDGSILKRVNPREEEPGWTTLKKETIKNRLIEAKQDGLTTSLTVFAGDEKKIDTLMSDPITHAENLLADIMPIMKEYEFDDLNLDIESIKDASVSSQQQFTEFTRTLKKGMEMSQLGTLTVDITILSIFQTQRINPKEVAEIADRIVLMAYDYHNPGSYVAGPVSPLGGGGTNRFNDVKLSIQKALEFIPREKLLLGVPLYGYEWETLSSIPGAPVIPGTGKTASDRRVQELLTDCAQCILGRDAFGNEPYVIYPDGNFYHQIFYTDALSIEKKHTLAKEMGIAGVAYWAMGYEGTETLSPSFK